MKKYILSFFIPIIILILSFFYNDFFSKSILISDLSSQYYHFLYKFIEIINGNGNLFYTFDFGLGTSMYSIFVYYLMSLSNIFLFFFSVEKLYLYIVLIIIVKIGLCGLTMYQFLKYHFKNNYLIIFSTSYALSTFILSNYFQIMWLDNYVLAPLVFLGIDKIIDKDKPLLYEITLFLSILNNYYMGFILCLFSAIYYLYKCFIKNKKLLNIKTFIISSFLSGMMTMFTHLIALKEILDLNRINKFELGFNTDFSKVISSFFIGNDMESIVNYTYPKLYIGILMLFLLFVYFFNQKISKKEKKITIFLLILFLNILIFKPLNTIFHSFSSPIGFNFRYVYLINIFLIYLSCKSFENINGVPKIYKLIYIYVFFILCFIVFITARNNIYFIILSLIFAIIYSLMFYFSKTQKIIYIIFFLEIIINSIYVYNNFDTLESKEQIINSKILNIVNNIKENESSIFYRMDLLNLKMKTNDNLFYDYYSASTWLSTIKYSELQFLKKISYNTGINSYHFKNSDIMNSILGIKYYADIKSNDELIYTYDEMNIYKNNNASNLGFIVDDSSKEKLVCSDSFKCQEKILNMMTNDNTQIYNELDVAQNSNIEYTIKDNSDIYIYFEAKYENETDFQILINDKIIWDSSSYVYDIENIIKLDGVLENKYKIGDKIKIQINDNAKSLYDVKIKLYNYNYSVYVNKINKLKQNQLNLIDFKDNYIKGTIEGNGILFLSIPYSEYWNIYIDGTKVETVKLFDAFLGVDIPDGEHTIELIYKIDTFKYGITISIISTIIFIFYNYKKYCFRK